MTENQLPAPVAAAEPVTCRVMEMQHSAGTPDYYVSIECGGRTITPHKYRIKGRAEYDVAEWTWVFNGGERPRVIDFDTDEPALSHPAALSGGDSEPVACAHVPIHIDGKGYRCRDCGASLVLMGQGDDIEWATHPAPSRADAVTEALIARLWPNGLGPNNIDEIATFIEEERKCEAEYRAALAPPPVEPAQGVTEAAQALVDFAWSAVVTDCTESAEYLNRLVDNLRAALAAAPEGSGGGRWECASEGCGKPATVHFVRGDVGSWYCRECYMRVQALAGDQS